MGQKLSPPPPSLPTEKQNNPPLKSETYFQEMIPRKKTQKFHKNLIFSLGAFKIL